MLTEKFIASNDCIRKQERSEFNNLSFHFKKLAKKTIKTQSKLKEGYNKEQKSIRWKE